MATYSFFIASVFGRQYIDRPYPSVFKEDFEHKGEFLIPVFSIIQFLLYMGLLKVMNYATLDSMEPPVAQTFRFLFGRFS